MALLAIRFLEGGPPALTTRDALLLADFQNHTGEQVFDGTLSQALAVQLAQSPYLNIVPEDRVRETLRLMGREPNERPTGAVAREACQRMGLKAMVGGSISRLGTLYVLLVDATNCETAASLAREQGSAETQEQVLETLGRMTSALRGRLGESLKSVEQFDVPIAQATTPSLEALRAYTLGLAQRARGAELESVPLLERALQLDPRFAAAATTLSVARQRWRTYTQRHMTSGAPPVPMRFGPAGLLALVGVVVANGVHVDVPSTVVTTVSLPDAVNGIFQTDARGLLINANPATARILGYDSPEEVLEAGEIDWSERAAEVLRKKFGEGLPVDLKEKARRIRFMQYRGFAAEHYPQLSRS